jgi:hypothetical protein
MNVDYFQSIKAHIILKLTEIKTVRLWNGQTEEGADPENIDYPAIFLGYEDVDFTANVQSGKNEQTGVFDLTVRIANRNLVDNANDDSTEWDILRLKQDVYKVLQKFVPTGAKNELLRKTEELDQDGGQVYVYLQTYSSNYLDKSANDTITGSVTKAVINSNMHITNDLYKTAPNFDELNNTNNWVGDGLWNPEEPWIN